ncbi:hypothetical protein [Mesorhizobium sp. STM 4661]|uniref:hypothetical protein n=1 Tax=Mesorhizobium sp. STM 4661 TaxID=1297570 RepID=UPI0003AB1A6C|nr:hypothetical protein [Mesorhizobium sp. STM 4661]
MSGAAYSKPVSALQRSISYFFGAFFARRFLAIARLHPHISHPAGSGTEKAVAAFVFWCLYFIERIINQT